MPRLLLALLLVASLGSVWMPVEVSARTLKIATVVPDGSSWMVEMRKAAAEIEKKTGGRVKLKFYPGGVMGNDKTVLRKMRAGQLHGGAFTSGALASAYADIELYSLPLVFRSYAEVDYVRKRMDAALKAGLEANGYAVLGISDSGFAYLMSQQPVRQVSDLKGKKVWIQEDDVMSQIAFEVAGVSPVQLPLADVYTALQTGLVDTVGAPPIAAIAFQWHTKIKYVTDVPLMYLVGVFAIDERVFSKISPADQKIVRDVVGKAVVALDRASRDGDRNAREALAKQGIEFVPASSDAELARWRELTEQALVKLRAKQIYSDEMIDLMHDHLETYRKAGGP